MRVRGVLPEELPSVTREDWVDRSRQPFIDGGTAWVPVRDGLPFDREIGPAPRYCGRGYYMIGDIALVHGRRPGPDEIRRIAELKSPRGIIWREALADITRTPRTEVMYGECGEVRHRESGYTYILDPSKVMFSQGNRTEKARIAGLIRSGLGNERVADLFAGIGYFAIPAAGAGARVHAMEINPAACGYLRRNAALNGLAGRITIDEGDCRDHLCGPYHRILMGHFDAIAFLPQALCHAGPGTILHLHSIGPCEERIRTIVQGAGFSCGIEVHKVKKYRPHAWHVVQDITLA
jgi:tRNA wybutosine-synthesizing protein 2